MASDAIIAFPIGLLYDKYRSFSLLLTPITALFIPLSLFIHIERASLYFASILWGLSMGGVETVMRASVADIVDYSSRPIAYGIFSTAIGFSILVNGIVSSLLYQIGKTNWIILMTLILEIQAIITYGVLIKLEKHRK
jgi:MFS family permease